MDIFHQIANQTAVYNERTAIVLGLVTLAFALATFASCRSCISLITQIGLKSPLKNKVYQSFYRFHTIYWWFFGVSVVSHFLMAALHTGLPQAGDSDAPGHWIILILGLSSALTGLALFSSCRLCMKLPAVRKVAYRGKFHQFFTYHSYYWIVMIFLVTGHFLAGYLHVGIWPAAG